MSKLKENIKKIIIFHCLILIVLIVSGCTNLSLPKSIKINNKVYNSDQFSRITFKNCSSFVSDYSQNFVLKGAQSIHIKYSQTSEYQTGLNTYNQTKTESYNFKKLTYNFEGQKIYLIECKLTAMQPYLPMNYSGDIKMNWTPVLYDITNTNNPVQIEGYIVEYSDDKVKYFQYPLDNTFDKDQIIESIYETAKSHNLEVVQTYDWNDDYHINYFPAGKKKKYDQLYFHLGKTNEKFNTIEMSVQHRHNNRRLFKFEISSYIKDHSFFNSLLDDFKKKLLTSIRDK